jgi:Zn-dependent protease with chaperone function
MSREIYMLRGMVLALAWLLALNAAFTALVAILTRWLIARDENRPPAVWLALRLAPAIVSVAFAALVFVPSYLAYEPRLDLGEGFDLTLTSLAVGAAAMVAASTVRGAAAWLGAWNRLRAWQRVSRPLTIGDGTVAACAVDVDAPILALAGVLRPRLLVTRGVVAALTDEELRAAVAHELGHFRAWDNLKRLAMRAAPDLLFLTPTATALEVRWASAAEHAADRCACGTEQARCALASALVKIARLMPPRTPLAEPISTLVDGGEITSRVQWLLSDAVPGPARSRRRPIALAAAAAAFVAYAPLLRAVHEATEVLVRTLP